MRCQSWKIDKKLIFGDFARVCVQIDVFGSSSNLLGMTLPFQFFWPKNHFIPFKSWFKSHNIPILCLKNPTQIGETHFGELWKVIFMLLFAYNWPIKFAGVHFMVRLSGWRITAAAEHGKQPWQPFVTTKLVIFMVVLHYKSQWVLKQKLSKIQILL